MSKHWDEGYTCLPNNFGDDVQKDSHLRVLLKIMTFHYCDEKRLSNSYLMKITGKSTNTVSEAMIELERLGYVKQISRGDNINSATYQMTIKFGVAKKGISRNEIGGISRNEIGGISRNENKELNININKHKERESEPSKAEQLINYWNSKSSNSLLSVDITPFLLGEIARRMILLKSIGIDIDYIHQAIDNFDDAKLNAQEWFKGDFTLINFLKVKGQEAYLKTFLDGLYNRKQYVCVDGNNLNELNEKYDSESFTTDNARQRDILARRDMEDFLNER